MQACRSRCRSSSVRLIPREDWLHAREGDGDPKVLLVVLQPHRGAADDLEAPADCEDVLAVEVGRVEDLREGVGGAEKVVDLGVGVVAREGLEGLDHLGARRVGGELEGWE